MPKITPNFGKYFLEFSEKQQRDFRMLYMQGTHSIPQIRRFITEAYKKFNDDTLIIECNLLRFEDCLYLFDYESKEWQKQEAKEIIKPAPEPIPPVKSAPAPEPTAQPAKKKKPPKPNHQGFFAEANGKGLKVTVVLEPASITRVDSIGKKQTPLKININGKIYEAVLNSKSYRKAIAKIDEMGVENCNAILSGSLNANKIESAGVAIQPKKIVEES